MTRARLIYIALALATIAAGLLVHEHGTVLGPITRDVLSDALWATMVAWWVAALVPRARLLVRSGVAYAICAGVEVSQRYHTPALDAIRATGVGQLVLGSGFDARDLASYALGVAAAALLEATVVARKKRLVP